MSAEDLPVKSGNNGLVACHDCDLLIDHPIVPDGHRLLCPRCGCVLLHPKKASVEHSLALAIAGLVLFVPANFLPVFTLKLLGQSHGETLFSSIFVLAREGQPLVACIVFLCSILVPLLKLLLMFKISFTLHFGYRYRFLAKSFRYYLRLDSWGMLEVYMLGILVSIVKLADLADVIPGMGLYSFVGLLLLTLMMSACIDEETFWDAIEERRADD